MQYLQSGNIVFYGAADIGKSLLVEETDDLQRIERLADLADPVAEYVALDDIYCLYQEYQSSSNQDLKERFEEVLARDYGVCLVTRSRSLDWLVTRTEFYELIDTSEFKFLARRYDEDEAVASATELISNLSADEIRTNIDRLEYTYEFEHDSFDNYTTYVPHIVLRSSALGDSGGLFPSDVGHLSRDGMLSSLRGFAGRLSESIGFSNVQALSTEDVAAAGSEAMDFLQDYERVYEDTIQLFLDQNQESIQAATASVVGGIGVSAAPIVGPLLVGALLRPDGTAQARDATADFFGELLDDELLPTTRCTLEEEMEVPPMTLEYFRAITRPEFHSQLTRLMEADIDNLEAIATQAQAELDEIQDDVDHLFDRVTVIEDFISTRTQDAVEPYDALRADLEELERQYLRVQRPVSIDGLELQNVDVEDRYHEVRTGSQVQVFRGPHGTGKTTLSYRLCQRFAADKYTVRIPRFDEESRSFVKTALEGIQGPVVVFTSYRVGAYSADDAAQIKFLLNLVDNGIIDKLLIECRDEVFAQLDDEMQTQTANERAGSRKAELWRFKDVFELPKIEEDGIQAIAEWVGEVKDEPDAIQRQLSSIIDIAGQNPEVAKIAARMVCDGQDLSHIQTEDQLIWQDIQNLTAARSSEIESAQRTIVTWLAVTRGLTQDELRQVTEIRRDNFLDALDNLSRYLQTSDDDTHQLIPDVYQEIIFREECLGQLDRYVQILADEELEQYLPEVALNIAMCANVQDQEPYPNLRQKCRDGTDVVLSMLLDLDDAAHSYYKSLETLRTTNLPVPEPVVSSHKLVDGIIDQLDLEAGNAYRSGTKVHTTNRPEELSLNVFSDLAANYVLAEDYEALDALVEDAIETYSYHQQTSPDASSMLQYRGETSYEFEMQYLLACLGHSFERLAVYRDADELPDDIESILEVILACQDEVQYPHPDPFEDSQSVQTTVVFYSQAVAGIAHVINEPAVIESLLAHIHTELRQTFQDLDGTETALRGFGEDDWLVRAHGLFIKSLMYSHELSLVDNWPSAIEAHVNEMFEPEHQCQFYKYIVEWGATRAEMTPRPEWLIWILSHDGILSVAVDDDFDFMVFDDSYQMIRSYMAACLGVFRTLDNPSESAELHELLETRINELDNNYSRLYQAVVQELGTIDEIFRR